MDEINIIPWLTVAVRTQDGMRDIKFVVDTGFDGELAIPHSYMAWFGTSDDTLDVRFEDGDELKPMYVPCEVGWTDGLRPAIAMYIGGENPLLGMELLDDCIVTLEIENGQGEIVIEASQ